MKFLKITALFLLASCSTLDSTQENALWSLGSQVASIGSTALGFSVTPAQLDGAAALIRTLAGAKKPAPAEVKTALVMGTDSRVAADKLAAIIPVIQTAVNKGVPMDTAIETTAAKLNLVANRTR